MHITWQISYITTVFTPAYPPRVRCLTGSKEFRGIWCHPAVPPGFPLALLMGSSCPFLYCPVCSMLSVSTSPLIIPFRSSLHLPNKIKQKEKNHKIKLQFSSPCQPSPNLNSCLFSDVPNPSLPLPHSPPFFLNFRLFVYNRWFK